MFNRAANLQFVAIASLILAAACVDQPDLTAPQFGPQGVRRTASISNGVQVVRRSSGLGQDVSATATIDGSGGVITIPSVGLTVTFPAGAVSDPVEITVTATKGDHVSYEFQPHGLQFAKPVEVSQALRGTAAELVASARLNDLIGGYVPRGREDIDSKGKASVAETYAVTLTGTGAVGNPKVATFSINHFSGYILGWGRSLITTILP
jgi:hypothetical protein